jgi:hypothetical protein
MPFKAMIGGVAQMGFGISEMRTWSIWEYRALVEGFNAANAAPEETSDDAPPIEAHRSQVAKLKAQGVLK